MKDNRLSKEEILQLCQLYMDGQLTKEEENALFLVLSHESALPQEATKTLCLLQAERKVFQTEAIHRRHFLRYSSIAAVLIVLIAIAIPFYGNISTAEDETFVVWQDGEKITGEKARKLVEENQQIDMEMIRQVMRQQREMLKRNFASVNMDDYDY